MEKRQNEQYSEQEKTAPQSIDPKTQHAEKGDAVSSGQHEQNDKKGLNPQQSNAHEKN